MSCAAHFCARYTFGAIKRLVLLLVDLLLKLLLLLLLLWFVVFLSRTLIGCLPLSYLGAGIASSLERPGLPRSAVSAGARVY